MQNLTKLCKNGQKPQINQKTTILARQPAGGLKQLSRFFFLLGLGPCLQKAI